MWKTYSGGSHVFAKVAKSLKAGEENGLYDEARIERHSFFEAKQFLSEQSSSLPSQTFA